MIQNNTDEEVGIIYLKHQNRARMKIQERECRKEMRENGIKVAAVFCDVDSSSPQTPGIRAALQYCEANSVDYVLAYDIENFGTTEKEFDFAHHNFFKHGTEPLFLYNKWESEYLYA